MHAKAPGTPHPNLTFYAYFNASVQMFDISRPVNTGWFIPPQAGELEEFGSFNRNTGNIFVEWDRRIIWAMTNTGMYLLSTPELGEPILKPMAAEEWALPGLNVGHG